MLDAENAGPGKSEHMFLSSHSPEVAYDHEPVRIAGSSGRDTGMNPEHAILSKRHEEPRDDAEACKI